MVVLSRKLGKTRQEEARAEESQGEEDEEGGDPQERNARNSHKLFERLDLSYLVNPTPVKVNPKQPLEMVVSLFKKIG
jgi:hypothetical protein